MAKRRRKKPNIPKATLEQARQDSDVQETPNTPESGDTANDSAPVATVSKTTADDKSRSRRRRRDLQSAQLKRNDDGGLDAEFVAERLANPTKIVTEEDLKADYGFVIRDLRNMGILAAGLFVALIGVALVIL